MRGHDSSLVIACLSLFGLLVLGAPASASPAVPADSTQGPLRCVAATYGAGGCLGWHGPYQSQGTLGQVVQGSWWNGNDRLLHTGFWNLLRAAEYLPVPVHLFHFAAVRSGDAVVLRWRVADEGGTAGFEVYREIPPGPRERLTPFPLSGLTDYEYRDRLDEATGARYWLAEIARTGSTAWFGPVEISPDRSRPGATALAAPRPNPVVSGTQLGFSLPAAVAVRLDVFDVRGRLVSTVVQGPYAAGEHLIPWDGRGADGAVLAAAVYLIRLEAGGVVRTQRLVIAR